MQDLFKNKQLHKIHSRIAALIQTVSDKIKKPKDEREEAVQKDVTMVGLSSEILQISEFRFFQMSYSTWYGHELPEKSMENYFREYMLNNIVPHWVRHTSRRVLTLYNQGKIDPAEFNIDHPIHIEYTRESQVFNTAFIIIIYTIFFVILSI